MLKLYIDNCCYNRPFDDLRQEKNNLEAQAIKLIVDKYLYNNSFPEYNEESYYRLWKETIPFDEWAEDAPSFEWEELVNNTEIDITELKEEKIKEAGIEKRFQNDDLESTLLEIKEYIESLM